jgi:hypothetical protein
MTNKIFFTLQKLVRPRRVRWLMLNPANKNFEVNLLTKQTKTNKPQTPEVNAENSYKAVSEIQKIFDENDLRIQDIMFVVSMLARSTRDTIKLGITMGILKPDSVENWDKLLAKGCI